MSKVHRLQEREEANKVGGLLWPEGVVTCAGGGAFCKRRWSTYPGGGCLLQKVVNLPGGYLLERWSTQAGGGAYL